MVPGVHVGSCQQSCKQRLDLYQLDSWITFQAGSQSSALKLAWLACCCASVKGVQPARLLQISRFADDVLLLCPQVVLK